MTAANSAEPSRAGLPALTGARGVAAWFVVLYHVRPGLSTAISPQAMAILGKGYLAVDFFFMLSGFVLWLNYRVKLRGGGRRAIPAFLGRRVARIWPLHMAVLTGAVAMALVLEATGKAQPEQYPWSELPLHILLMQNWGLTDRLSWNDPAWSISCEWAAYLLLPLLAWAIDWRRLPSAVLIGAVAGASLSLHLVMAWSGATTLGADIPRFGLPRALIEFVIGTMVCALWLRWRERRAITAGITGAAAAALAISTIAGLLPETLGVPLGFAALLLALALTATARANPLASRPLVYLGEISYATYLVHLLLYTVFKLLFVDDPYAVPFATLAGFGVLTLAVSALLCRLVELPAQTALRRIFEGGPRERTPAPAL